MDTMKGRLAKVNLRHLITTEDGEDTLWVNKSDIESFIANEIRTALKSIVPKKKLIHERDWDKATEDYGWNAAIAEIVKRKDDYLSKL